ncbi:MAG: carbon starvation CstA family protein [Pirellulales bacterium]
MMVTIVLVSAAILLVAYLVYGRILVRLLRVDGRDQTPAYALQDDVDYVPLDRGPLMAQHFSAIAAAGPIVGPILAGAMFGWLPALLWILAGSIFIGGVHDFTSLMASVRHRGLSIAEVVRQHMSHRSVILFLVFIWFALVYIIVAFTDITASSFIGAQELGNGDVVTGAGIASSSLMYLALPIVMGLLVRYTRLTMGWATIIFLPLVGLAIWGGQYVPFDVAKWLQQSSPSLTATEANVQAHKLWDVALLTYCAIASIVPMWLLLQPRGQLGGVFLYAALASGALGLLIGGQPINLPAYTGWTSASGQTLAPMLFITIACGACSGFHALIASGTTSKQIRTEVDARSIGYGTMLLEAMVAIISLCCVMMVIPGSELHTKSPNFIYASGIGNFLETVSIPRALGVSFALMAFTTFVYDTLDVCARLGRYVIQELTGWHDARGKWLGTGITVAAPLFFILQESVDKNGNPVPIWLTFWGLFGASNQLLAALTLLGVTVWLWRTRRAKWVWYVTGLPTLFMFAMSNWALVTIIRDAVQKGEAKSPVTIVAGLLVVLAVLMLLEAVAVLARTFGSPPTGKPDAPARTPSDGLLPRPT